MINLVYVRN